MAKKADNEKPNKKELQASVSDIVKVSVRTLVEFILRCGDIDTRFGRLETDAMQEGAKLHRKIQKQMGSNYSAEVPLKLSIPIDEDGEVFELVVDGRADGVERRENDTFLIDEIKCTYGDVNGFKAAEPVHLAQARCYAYMLATLENVGEDEAVPTELVISARGTIEESEQQTFGVQLTYCNIETENIKRFTEELTYCELKEWFDGVIREYKKWAVWERKWMRTRNETIRTLEFPYEYRPGQKDFAAGVYRTIVREKKLFAMAPTGVGKTLSTVYPTVKAMGEGKVEKIFYLTAKTMLRTVAEESFALLMQKGLKLKSVTITAKEKVCVLDKPECNPIACERAKGHFDRINDAIYELLTNEETITRDIILQYAERFCVCPFEFCLDLTLWADAVICDYNYVFDPTVSLKRFFAQDTKRDFVFLIDEVHNLPERAREMYSATLVKEDFLLAKRTLGQRRPKLAKRLESCNKAMLELKRQCDSFLELEEMNVLAMAVGRFLAEAEDYLKDATAPKEEREVILDLFFTCRQFGMMYDFSAEDYRYFVSYAENGDFYARVQCMRPARALEECFRKGKSAILFSATLLPVQYYKGEIVGEEEPYAIYVPSPFLSQNRKILIAGDAAYRYSDRGAVMYQKAADYIARFTAAKKGNYLVFFSSYKMLTDVAERLRETVSEEDAVLLFQKNSMTEEEREAFLREFSEENEKTVIGLCVLGGIFGEGIDLKGERLIGAVIVGTGLPLVCEERELFKRFYEDNGENGFDSAYLYPGMNKVQQAAGRVIRTMEDRGAVLLLDSRFLQKSYMGLFPREWSQVETVTLDSVEDKLKLFWKGEGADA